jgi:Tfp pilus assembly protein PilF
MARTLTIGLLLCCACGCANFRALDKPFASLSRRDTPPPATAPTLADPRNQEAAIAWETARLAEQRAMDEEAIDAYLEVRRLDPAKPGVSHALAVLYDRSGMTDAATREYAAAMVESPNEANLHCDYGYFLYWTGKPEQAEASLRKALQLKPGHVQATINLAMVVGSQGRYDEAQKLFTEAIGPAAAMHNVGMLHLRAGQMDQAKVLLAEAKRLDPSITQSEPALERLAFGPKG